MKKTSTNRRQNMISTTAIAKHFDLPAKSVFNFLLQKSWIDRAEDHWRLTGKGEFEGGEYIKSKKYGEYIAWPADIVNHMVFHELLELPLTVTALGAGFNIGPHRFNALLAELGWQQRFHKGWTITEKGKKKGGTEREDSESGVPYTVWSRDCLGAPALKSALTTMLFAPIANAADSATTARDHSQQPLDFSGSGQPPSRTRDGHQPEYKEHHQVCNWLYLMNVVHAHLWALEDSSLGVCDFYLPAAHLYLECWPQGEDAKTMRQKIARLEFYKQEKLAYIELKAEELDNLDSALPKMLLKHGITVY